MPLVPKTRRDLYEWFQKKKEFENPWKFKDILVEIKLIFFRKWEVGQVKLSDSKFTQPAQTASLHIRASASFSTTSWCACL